MKRVLWFLTALILCLCACGREPSSPISRIDPDSDQKTGQTFDSSSRESGALTVTAPVGSGPMTENPGEQTAANSRPAGAVSTAGITASTTSRIAAPTVPPTTVAAAGTPAITPPKEDYIKQLGISQAMLDASVYAKGNQSRLAAVMKKASRGEPITIGFLGGSITDGSNVPIEKSYARLTKAWWEATFPKARITYVNAGIGSTGSIIGVHRVDADLLSKKPDFVVLEYAVNDGTDLETRNAYESLVRRILNAEKQPALLLLFMCSNGGGSAQESHAVVGAHYNLPMISYKNGISLAVKENRFPWTKFSDDTVHPNEFGYAVCGAFIKTYLTSVADKLDEIPMESSPLPVPISKDYYKNTTILGSKNYTPKALGDFQKTNDALYFWKNGWEVKYGATRPIVFEIQDARRVWLLYRRDITGNQGVAAVAVDGAAFCDLDGHFQGGWGELGGLQLVAKSDVPQDYTIAVRMKDGQSKSFVLAAVYVDK